MPQSQAELPTNHSLTGIGVGMRRTEPRQPRSGRGCYPFYTPPRGKSFSRVQLTVCRRLHSRGSLACWHFAAFQLGASVKTEVSPIDCVSTVTMRVHQALGWRREEGDGTAMFWLLQCSNTERILGSHFGRYSGSYSGRYSEHSSRRSATQGNYECDASIRSITPSLPSSSLLSSHTEHYSYRRTM